MLFQRWGSDRSWRHHLTQVMWWIPWGWLIATWAVWWQILRRKWEGQSEIRKRFTPWWGILRGVLCLGSREHIWEECEVLQSSVKWTADGCFDSNLDALEWTLRGVCFRKIENLEAVNPVMRDINGWMLTATVCLAQKWAFSWPELSGWWELPWRNNTT